MRIFSVAIESLCFNYLKLPIKSATSYDFQSRDVCEISNYVLKYARKVTANADTYFLFEIEIGVFHF